MRTKKLIANITVIIILSISMLNAFIQPVSATTTIYPVIINVEYGQTEARSMLTLINDFRQNKNYDEPGGAWYWNSTNTAKVECGTLSNLTYDYNLEQIAMQRAAEIALYYSHTRPNSEICFTCTYNGTSTWGENIAAGYGLLQTAEEAYLAWREDSDPYSGQGHRRNMLGNYTAIGIGHVVYNGVHYWTQEFGYSNSGASETVANNKATNVNVEIDSDIIADIKNTSLSTSNIELNCGETKSTPKVTSEIQTTNCWPTRYVSVTRKTDWIISDSTIVEITDGKIKGLKSGKTTLKPTVDSSLVLKVTVNGVSLETATITLDNTEYVYDGNEKRPVPTVELNGTTLSENDYEIIYSNNTAIGQGIITIIGKGSYSGEISTTFDITCNHANTKTKNKKSATCAVDGYTGDLCCKDCSAVIKKGKKIPMLGHNYIGEYSKDENGHYLECSNGCGSKLEEAHVYGEEFTKTATTHSKICNICAYALTEEHKGGTATCIKKAKCDVCGVRYGSIDSTKHNNTELYNQKEATTEEDGYTGDLYCNDCGVLISEGESIPKLEEEIPDEEEPTVECEHLNTEKRNIKAPTCMKAGNDGDLYCVDCNKLLQKGNKIAKLEHNYSGEYIKDNTSHILECTYGCGTKIRENHDFGDEIITTETTHSRTCRVCEYILIEEHNGGIATCSEKAKCDVCGIEYGDIDSTNHIELETRNHVDATCMAQGYTGDVYCKSCNELLQSGRIIEEVQHNYNNLIGYNENGHILECVYGCGNKITLEHIFEDAFRSISDSKHAKKCMDCNYAILENHKGGIATCSSKAICDICKVEYGNINPENHVNKNITNSKDATIEEVGYTGDLCCADCHIVLAVGKEIPKLVNNETQTPVVDTTNTINTNPLQTPSATINKPSEETKNNDNKITDSKVNKTSKKITSPKTSDDITKYLYMAIVSILGGIVIIDIKLKEKFRK